MRGALSSRSEEQWEVGSFQEAGGLIERRDIRRESIA